MKRSNLAVCQRPAQDSDRVNWLNAPAVPIKILQMLQTGHIPVGQILVGPGGQKTYRGPIATRDVDNSWRDELSQLPDA